MAVKKRRARRRKRRLSDGTQLSRPRRRHMAAPRRRRGKRKSSRKTRLSDLWNPTVASQVGRQIVGNALGGATWVLAEKMMPMSSPGQKILYGGIAAFVTGAMFKMPNISAGLMGAATYSAFKDSGFLGDEGENSYVKNMDQMPLMLMNDQPIDPAQGMAMLSEAMPGNYGGYATPAYASPYAQPYY